jgi:hypothetical protein
MLIGFSSLEFIRTYMRNTYIRTCLLDYRLIIGIVCVPLGSKQICEYRQYIRFFAAVILYD